MDTGFAGKTKKGVLSSIAKWGLPEMAVRLDAGVAAA
jgi:hypothetical protein